MQASVPLGHLLLPCLLQGLHSRVSSSIILAFIFCHGPKPNSGEVAQNTVTVGVLNADAICRDMLSLHIRSFAFFMIYIVSERAISPEKSKTSACAFIFLHISQDKHHPCRTYSKKYRRIYQGDNTPNLIDLTCFNISASAGFAHYYSPLKEVLKD